MLPWVLGRLRDRLRPMLERAGAEDLAARVEPETLAAGLPELERLARATEAELSERIRAASPR